MSFYEDKSDNYKYNAQRNLSGKSHYCEDETLRYFARRITYSTAICNGMLFAVIDSHGIEYKNDKRGFFLTIFDPTGTTIDIENVTKKTADPAKPWDNKRIAYPTTQAARKALREIEPKINVVRIVSEAIHNIRYQAKSEIQQLRTENRLYRVAKKGTK
jgi:hypothetical protein